MKDLYTFQALLPVPFYLGLIILIANWYASRYITDSTDRKFFWRGLILRFVGAFFFTLVHKYVLQYGDTWVYYLCVKRVYEAFWTSPSVGIQIFFSEPGEYNPDTWDVVSRFPSNYYLRWSSLMVVKIGSFFGLLSGHSYWVVSLCMGTFAFSGMWAMYKGFIKLYPHLKEQIGFATMYIPSVFFWGSALMKDTVIMGALGWLTFSFLNILVFRRWKLISLTVIVVASILIFRIKAYVMIAFLPSAGLLYFIQVRRRITNRVLRIMSTPFLLLFISVGAYFSQGAISEAAGKFALENIVETAIVYQQYHFGLVQGRGKGSSYDLGEIDPTLTGLIKTFPKAVNVALFRPYLWEVKNLQMIIAAVESLGMLIFSLYILYNIGLGAFITGIFKNPIIVFCFIFAVIFAFAVGFSTYNFGSLSRYRIPLLPFYVLSMIILNSEVSVPHSDSPAAGAIPSGSSA
ncbi:MAG: hypothetical protein AAGI38_11915 [Bacteroidota bacterium]